MIKLPLLISEWNICLPTLFRFIDSEYVDTFFTDGSLRISSFSQFHKHADEQRLDKGEGITFFIHRTNQGGGQTLATWADQGANAYILSTTMKFDKDLCKSFNSDSYMRINDPAAFGIAVAHHIPFLRAGFEGPCLYQEKKIIERDLGYIDVSQFKDLDITKSLDVTLLKELGRISLKPDNVLPPNRQLSQFILSQMGHYPMFLKDKKYSHQVEYRFIWMISRRADDYIDIKVPEAIPFCEKPNPLIE